MKLLVTGAAGLVGSACVSFFAAKNWEVVGIDNNGRSKFFGTPEKKGNHFDLDIRDQGMMEWLFTEHKFDAIIHAAAQPSHDYATDHVLEDFDVNARGTVILLEVMRKHCPDAVFVHVSTDKVYGERMRADLEELETRFQPKKHFDDIDGHEHEHHGFWEYLGLDFAGDRSFFGCSKTAADLYAQEYAARFGFKIGIFRPGCITGQSHEGAEQHGFLAYLAKCIKEGRTYKIFGHKGKQVRDQIHAFDLANAFFNFIENPVIGGVYNIGGGPDRSVSVLEAIDIIEKETNRKAFYEFHEGRKGDRVWDVHDVSKFRRDYPNWDYQYSLQDIIKDVCQK